VEKLKGGDQRGVLEGSWSAADNHEKSPKFDVPRGLLSILCMVLFWLYGLLSCWLVRSWDNRRVKLCCRLLSEVAFLCFSLLYFILF
jgi:hypothetical protein